MKNSILIITISLLFSGSSYAVPGELDPDFGTNGIISLTIGTFAQNLSIALQEDNKIVAGGRATIGGVTQFALARYDSEGTIDTTFGSDGIVSTIIGTTSDIAAIAVQTDGKIVAGGKATIGGVTQFVLARYDSDGVLDTAFGTNGIVSTIIGTTSDIAAIAVQTDGKIIVGGRATIGGVNQFTLARYDSDGVLDTAFGTNGIVSTIIGTNSDIAAIAVQTDGKIVAGGFAVISGVQQFALARYDSEGELDTAFGADGVVTTNIGGSDMLNSLALQADGKIVTGGTSANRFALARYNSDGSLDSTFGTNGIVTISLSFFDNLYSVVVQPDGKIVGAGSTLNLSFTTVLALFRCDSDGSLDDTFGTNGVTTTEINSFADARSLALQVDGKIVAGGITVFGGVSQFLLARYFGFPLAVESFEVNLLINQSVTISLPATNEDNSLLTFSIVTDPEYGTLSDLTQPTVGGTVQSATVLYTPNEYFSGKDSFSFKATNTDVMMDSNTATVSIAVMPTFFQDTFANRLVTKYGRKVRE